MSVLKQGIELRQLLRLREQDCGGAKRVLALHRR